MRAIACMVLLVGCGAAAAPVVERPHAEPTPPPSVAPGPRFAGHGALVLRTLAATPADARRADSPPLYAELAADGSMTGTRCGATRFTDEGVLEREGVPVARVMRDGDALAIETADGTSLGWRIEGNTLVTGGSTRFTSAGGTITPSGASLPAVTVAPTSTDDALALAVLATLLVCDDVGP